MTIKPVDFKEANETLAGMPIEDVQPLQIFRSEGKMLSKWRVSFWQRIKILFTGHIYLCVKGEKHPPVWIDVSGIEKHK